MKIEKNKILYIYIFSYLSMYLGFFNNEDFAFGTIKDYLVHIHAANLMEQGIASTFLNYDNLDGGAIPHSPVYILYFMYVQNIFGDVLGRLINMHLILLLPYFFYLSLKLKFNFDKNDIRNLLPLIFFISPYFRSGALWIDDNVIGLTFLTFSIYYYLKFENNKKKSLNYIFLNVLFLALASYIRPIYCIFGIYFFASIYLQIQKKNFLIYYVLLNIVLSLPAFYYVIILQQNEWFRPWILRTNITTTFSLSLSLIFFYTLPFIFCNFDKFDKIVIEKKFFFISIIYLIILLINFNLTIPYSGGFFYKISNLLFSNNYFFYLISFLSFYFYLSIFKNITVKKYIFFDLLLLTLLIIMEVDGVIYHEAYDPLFYIVSFLLVKNIFYSGVIKKLSTKSISYFFIFASCFFIMSVAKTYI